MGSAIKRVKGWRLGRMWTKLILFIPFFFCLFIWVFFLLIIISWDFILFSVASDGASRSKISVAPRHTTTRCSYDPQFCSPHWSLVCAWKIHCMPSTVRLCIFHLKQRVNYFYWIWVLPPSLFFICKYISGKKYFSVGSRYVCMYTVHTHINTFKCLIHEYNFFYPDFYNILNALLINGVASLISVISVKCQTN